MFDMKKYFDGRIQEISNVKKHVFDEKSEFLLKIYFFLQNIFDIFFSFVKKNPEKNNISVTLKFDSVGRVG